MLVGDAEDEAEGGRTCLQDRFGRGREGCGEPCGAARYLREGPRRFNELRGDVAGISAKVLSQRLQRLHADGIVERRVMPTTPPTVEYELTELGRELVPAVDTIVEVGHRLEQRRNGAR